MKLIDLSSAEFSALLASKAAVPGGGGASALAGALGAALGCMVGSLTVGKPKYAAVEEDIKSLMERAEALRVRLIGCVDKDAEAFEPLSRAYSIPKDAPGRDETMEGCLRAAAAVPLEIFDLCCEAIELNGEFAQKGSVLALSDAGTGAALCRAALFGAAVNVRINTKYMKDRAYAAEVDRHIDGRLEKYGRMADDIFNSVYGRYC